MSLDNVVSFLAYDVWAAVYAHPMDSVARRSGSRTIVLKDSAFAGIARASIAGVPGDILRPYLDFPCGLIRGILYNLGVDASVRARVSRGAATSFSIRLRSSDVFDLQLAPADRSKSSRSTTKPSQRS